VKAENDADVMLQVSWMIEDEKGSGFCRCPFFIIHPKMGPRNRSLRMFQFVLVECNRQV